MRADVIITTNEGKKRRVRRIRLTPDISRWLPNITYRNDGVVAGINLCAIVAAGSDDPWVLVTNLKKSHSTIIRYASRFQIEEWFKDTKHELGIFDLRTKDLKRMRRMVFLSCVSYGITLLIGTLAQRSPPGGIRLSPEERRWHPVSGLPFGSLNIIWRHLFSGYGCGEKEEEHGGVVETFDYSCLEYPCGSGVCFVCACVLD